MGEASGLREASLSGAGNDHKSPKSQASGALHLVVFGISSAGFPLSPLE